jgi:hypothetical protein
MLTIALHTFGIAIMARNEQILHDVAKGKHP